MSTPVVIILVLVIADPLGYVIWRTILKKPEARGWKKLIPFCWVFSNNNKY